MSMYLFINLFQYHNIYLSACIHISTYNLSIYLSQEMRKVAAEKKKEKAAEKAAKAAILAKYAITIKKHVLRGASSQTSWAESIMD